MSETPAAIAIAALTFALILIWLTRYRRRRRFQSGAAAERAAVDFARRNGYRVLSTQVAGKACIIVDGQPLESALRADLLLARWGRRYLGEVKSGHKAPNPQDRATRRQLLEYSLAFDVDGLLLFDMQAHRIRRIEFKRPRPRWRLAGPGLGLIVGFVAAHHAVIWPWLQAWVQPLLPR